MKTKQYKVKDLNTNKVSDWTLADILSEINRDHSEEWEAYDAKDWREGWDEWAEGDCFTLIK
tara:strand:+ start:264 stop:449 length:186 start_codon:yes stop_codon:yes gene_type:complete